MKNAWRRLAAAALIIAALSGCSSLTAEDLYTPPQLSERYLKLQTAINGLLSSGASYAPPASGQHRQSIQLEDLDGDGVGEVLAFFNFPGSDRPLRIYVFRQSEDGYEEAARIEGEGTGIDSISYADMDGDGVKEIAVGWQIALGINLLSLYTLRGYEVSCVLTTDYTEYAVTDMNGDGTGDIVAIRLSASELSGEAVLYRLTADGETVSSTARLSMGTEAVMRVRGTMLTDKKPALLLENRLSGAVGGGIVTDILTVSGDSLVNITLDDGAGMSTDTFRTTEVFCRDIDGDGVLDIPRPASVPSASETPYYLVQWFAWSSRGWARLTTSTYINYSDGWYLILPQSWVGHIAIRRADGTGERSIVFSAAEGEEIGRDFLTVYVLTGERREQRAAQDGRFVLLEEEDRVYAASITPRSAPKGVELTEDLVRDSFRIVYSEWITGET